MSHIPTGPWPTTTNTTINTLITHTQTHITAPINPSAPLKKMEEETKVAQQQQKQKEQKEKKEQKPKQEGGGEKKEKKEKVKKVVASDDSSEDPLEVSPAPSFIQHRIDIYDKIKARQEEELKKKEKKEITVTLRDGKTIKAIAWETTPWMIVEGISKQLAGKTVVAKVNGTLFDLTRPLEEDSRVDFLDINDSEGQAVFWHSSAHILGEACERHFGCLLEHGPPTDDGFFYDMRMMGERTISERDYPSLDKLSKQIVSEKQHFERLVMKKEELLEMFKYNDMKTYFIKEKIPDGESSTVYRCGPLIDLCLGPHIPNTNRVKAMAVHKNAATYWLGKAENEVLQRIYGISFPENKQLTEWMQWREEAKKRDHRLIGKQQELFFFHELSPGSCFFLPHGARIYNNLMQFIRSEYSKRGFHEVITPNMYNIKLWEKSGHWQNYQEHMFHFDIESEKFAMKPMNCPGHCLMFDLRPRSHRELPLRLADFGVLHRNEFSGALTGLTRVRRFQQDDAHIFCTHDQINSEIEGCLDFLKTVYDIFGFTLTMALSTRPDKAIGDIETWNKAEKQLEDALNKSGFEWKINPGDGAFYGPKIDISVQDATRRRYQCATIQLDFQLPERFDLTYQNDEGVETRPVMIHRAILGSVERMLAILTENYAGKWPFWLSPRQVCVVPVAPIYYEYANKVRNIFHDAGFHVDVDETGDTMNKKIRNAQVNQYNFIFVVGEKEQTDQTVNIRTRDNVVHGTFSHDDAIDKLSKLQRTKSKEL